MELTTKTARELKATLRCLKEVGVYDEIPSNPEESYIELYAKKHTIIKFKNELNEILDDKNPDEPILKYYERLYIKLMNLKEEIESVEKQ